MDYAIKIPTQLKESKSKVWKCQNDRQGFPTKQASLTMAIIKNGSTQMLE
jgi:hypothetical protein